MSSQPEGQSWRDGPRSRDFLATTELFRSLPAPAMDQVLERVEWVHLPSGETLFHQGEDGNAMYVIASGRVQVVVEGAGQEEVVREMGRGENLGELSLLIDRPRSATIRAIRDSQLLRLSRDSFQALLQEQPSVTLELTRILARWVRESNAPRSLRGIGTVAVVAGTIGKPHEELARSLASALTTHGETLVVTRSFVDRELGEGMASALESSAEHRQVTLWLNRQEQNHRFLVYCASADDEVWTRRCLRQADTVLTVVRPGDADGPPVDREPQREIADSAPEKGRRAPENTLVVVHPAGTSEPAGAGRWLRTGRYSGHHHVRQDHAGDAARLARHLAGRAIGVVLGGGGALGFAHVGVLRALREAGIEPDRFGGTSMGSIVAAMFARGLDDREVQEHLKRAWGRMQNRPHRTHTLPIYSLDSGDRIRRTLEWAFGDRTIEDHWHPYFCTSTNLTTGLPVVHRSGSLVRWIEASVSIPGIVPPAVTDDGELLADGALLNNLPSDIMVQEGRGPVVAVSVSTESEPRVRSGRRRPPSAWEALIGKALPFRQPPDFPNIVQVLHRSAVIGSVHTRRDVDREVDLYLKPRLTSFDMFSWDSLAAIVDAGYRHTVDRLESEPELVEGLRLRRHRTSTDRLQEMTT